MKDNRKEFLCPFPWLSSCVTTKGNFRVCPVSQSARSKGIVKNGAHIPSILERRPAPDVLNSSSLKELRRKMLAGENISDTCARCMADEAIGLPSLRTLEREKFPFFGKSYADQWTETDGTLRAGAPVSMVIFRLGNKCNLTCRMCGPSSSSAWYKEWVNTRHAGFQDAGERIVLRLEDGPVATPNPYGWAEEGLALDFLSGIETSLRRLHFSGGEPLLSRAHLQVLRRLVDTGLSSQISLEYNSNLTTLDSEILRLWERFSSVEIGVSVDGPPEVNEYIRFPSRTSTLLTNLRKLDGAGIAGRFWLTTTVQIYNVLYLDRLREWLLSQGFSRISPDISWHVLRAPKELSIFALPQPAKEEVARRLRPSEQFGKIADLLLQSPDLECFPDFLSLTRKMDQYRRQSIDDLKELRELLCPYFPS